MTAEEGEKGASIHRRETRYPARCCRATHTTADLPDSAEDVCLHGRLIGLKGERGCLVDQAGEVPLRWKGTQAGPREGDIVEVKGRVQAGQVLATQMRVLTPAAAFGQGKGDWHRFHGGVEGLQANLRVRGMVLQAIREFFAVREFLEVETPSLVREPGQEAHLQLFETEFRGETTIASFLVTSPEHQMKRLLGGGFERIFQIGRCFRNSERSDAHNPEFTMLEWYRAYASYEEIMEDVEQLVNFVACAVGRTGEIEYQGKRLKLDAPWLHLGVQEAFERFAGVEILPCEQVDQWRRRVRKLGYRSVMPGDSWEDIFFKILVEKVEPALGQLGAVFLRDYPACLAALAKLKEEDPGVAERVEVYISGLELANGFTELNDPQEQRRRFAGERQKRLQESYPLYPQDEEFLQMMEQGMPPAGGMALGVDRLVMLLGDAGSIDEVMAFPF